MKRETHTPLKRRKKTHPATVAKYAVLILYSALTLFPLFWVALTSLKHDSEVMSNPFGLPNTWNFKNYADAWIGLQVPRLASNSLIYMIFSTIIAVLLSSMAAYVLTRIWPIKSALIYFTVGLMLPLQAIVIPFVLNLRRLGLNNTPFSIILVYVVMNLSFNVFVLSGFFKSLPPDLEDAAMIDGCGYARTFFSIILPISKAGLATVSTFTAVNCWNDFYLALYVLVNDKLKTLNLALYFLKGTSERQARYALMAAGAVVLVIPIMVIYTLFQKQIVKGIVAGAVKG
jgi:ABC-type glycerol-3-phosphate transport system permease component